MSTCCPERSHVFANRSAWGGTLFQFVFPRACAQYEVSESLQVRAERQEPLALSVQLEHLAHSGRPLGSARPRNGRSASRFRFWWSPSPAHAQCGATPRAPCLLVGRAQRPPQQVGRRVWLRRRGIECCSPSMEVEQQARCLFRISSIRRISAS